MTLTNIPIQGHVCISFDSPIASFKLHSTENKFCRNQTLTYFSGKVIRHEVQFIKEKYHHTICLAVTIFLQSCNFKGKDSTNNNSHFLINQNHFQKVTTGCAVVRNLLSCCKL